MAIFIDQTGRSITLNKAPQRIISLVPSQTELLYDLGLADEVIGITKFCIHPDEWFRNKTRIGGTKQLNIELIKQLQPDLIIANKEENVKEQVEELEKQFPVWISDIKNMTDAYEMIEKISIVINKEDVANNIIWQIKEGFAKLPTQDSFLRTAYLIWQNPYMTVGGDTFIHSVLEVAGFANIYSNRNRYPETSVEELRTLNPELLFLSSEPYPFKQKHIDELQSVLPNTMILLIDGEIFSWYGSRLLQAPVYFINLQNQLK